MSSKSFGILAGLQIIVLLVVIVLGIYVAKQHGELRFTLESNFESNPMSFEEAHYLLYSYIIRQGIASQMPAEWIEKLEQKRSNSFFLSKKTQAERTIRQERHVWLLKGPGYDWTGRTVRGDAGAWIVWPLSQTVLPLDRQAQEFLWGDLSGVQWR